MYCYFILFLCINSVIFFSYFTNIEARPPVDIIWAMMIIWRVNSETESYRNCSVLCTGFASRQRYTARHSGSGRQPNCDVEQRAPPIFDRAAITLCCVRKLCTICTKVWAVLKDECWFRLLHVVCSFVVFVSDIVVFVLKRGVKLQLTHSLFCCLLLWCWV